MKHAHQNASTNMSCEKHILHEAFGLYALQDTESGRGTHPFLVREQNFPFGKNKTYGKR
jgi:hypothetical protein